MTHSGLNAAEFFPHPGDIPEPVLYGANRCLSDRYTLEQCMDLMVAKYLMGDILGRRAPFTLTQCFLAMRFTYKLSPEDATRFCYQYDLDPTTAAFHIALSYKDVEISSLFKAIDDVWNVQNQGKKGYVSDSMMTDGFLKAGRIKEKAPSDSATLTPISIPEPVLYIVKDCLANKQSPDECMEYLRAKFLMTYAIFDNKVKAPFVTFPQCIYAICQIYNLSAREAAQLCYNQCTDAVNAATQLAINYHQTADVNAIFTLMDEVWNVQNHGKKGQVNEDTTKAGFIKAGLLAVPRYITKLLFTPGDIPDHLLYGTNFCLSNQENAERCLQFLVEKYLNGDISGLNSPFTFLQCLQAVGFAYTLTPEDMVQLCYGYNIDAVTTSAHLAMSYQTTDIHTLFTVMETIWNVKNNGQKGLLSENTVKAGFIKAGLLKEPTPSEPPHLNEDTSPVIDGAQLCYNQNIDPATAITYLVLGYDKASLNDIADAMIIVWNINNKGAKGLITKDILMTGFTQAKFSPEQINTTVFQADVYVRDYIGDTGIVPAQGGSLSASPDVISRQDAIANYSDYLIQQWDNNTLSQTIKYGANNYLYVRAYNRGSSPDIINIRLYWAAPAMLISPSQWSTKNLIGDVQISKRINPGDHIVYEFMWPAGKIPYNGHYCFIAIIDSVRNPTPTPTDFHNDVEYQQWIANNNTVAWHNFDVVFASAQKPFTLFNNNAVLHSPLLRSGSQQAYSIKLYDAPHDSGKPLPAGTVITATVNGTVHTTTLTSTELPYTLCDNILFSQGKSIPIEVEVTLPASVKKGDTFHIAIAQFAQESKDNSPLGALNRLIVVQ